MPDAKVIVKQYIYLTIGIFFLALGLAVFLAPLKLSSGGVSTVATICLHIFKIPLYVTNILINMVLFAAGYKFLGKGSVFKTAYGIGILSAFLMVAEMLPPYRGDMLVANIAGGILVGIGEGMIIRNEGSTGGSDFAAIILNRFFPHVSAPIIMLIIDGIIISISGIVFKSLTVTVYSIASLYLSIKISDYICALGDEAKTLFIVSDKYLEISDYIMEKFERGITGIHCKGMYLKKDKTMLMCVVSPKELPLVVSCIRKIDINAFITVNNVTEVFGEGFKLETNYDKLDKLHSEKEVLK